MASAVPSRLDARLRRRIDTLALQVGHRRPHSLSDAELRRLHREFVHVAADLRRRYTTYLKRALLGQKTTPSEDELRKRLRLARQAVKNIEEEAARRRIPILTPKPSARVASASAFRPASSARTRRAGLQTLKRHFGSVSLERIPLRDLKYGVSDLESLLRRYRDARSKAARAGAEKAVDRLDREIADIKAGLAALRPIIEQRSAAAAFGPTVDPEMPKKRAYGVHPVQAARGGPWKMNVAPIPGVPGKGLTQIIRREAGVAARVYQPPMGVGKFVWEVYQPRKRTPVASGVSSTVEAAKKRATTQFHKQLRRLQGELPLPITQPFGAGWVSTPSSMRDLQARRREASDRVQSIKASRDRLLNQLRAVERSLVSRRKQPGADADAIAQLERKVESLRRRRAELADEERVAMQQYRSVDQALFSREGELMRERSEQQRRGSTPSGSEFVPSYAADFELPHQPLDPEIDEHDEPSLRTAWVRRHTTRKWRPDAAGMRLVRRDAGITTAVWRSGNSYRFEIETPGRRKPIYTGSAATPAAAQKKATARVHEVLQARQGRLPLPREPFRGSFGLVDREHRTQFEAHLKVLRPALHKLREQVDARDCRAAYRTLQAVLKRSNRAIEAGRSIVGSSSRIDRTVARVRELRDDAAVHFKSCVLR